MHKNKIIVTAMVVLVSVGFFALANNKNWFGQPVASTGFPDAKEELKKLYAAYHHADSAFDISGTIRLYDVEKENSFKEENSFHYSKMGHYFLTQLGYLQSYSNGDIVIQMDTLLKTVLLAKLKDTVIPQALPTSLPFDQLLKDTNQYKIAMLESANPKERTVLIKMEADPKIKSYAITYDAATYQVKQSEIVWWKKQSTITEGEADKLVWLTKIVYRYSQANKEAIATRINQIIEMREGKPFLTEQYKNYQLQTNY